ncbi:hypothetical protein JXB37_01330 [candidate division WOR-3 bacterium]|nr:hypothetical protein [candidate division WOR-3 bacterium]
MLYGGQGTSSNSNWSFGICRSTNGGTSWQRSFINQDLRGCCRSLAVAPSGPDTVWAGGWIAGAGALALSTDRGATWNRLGAAPAESVFGIAVRPDNAGRLFAATTGGVYRTTDAGATWSRVLSTPGMRAVAVSPTGPDTIAAAGEEGAFLSLDGGANWTQVNEGLDVIEVMCLLFAGVDRGELFAGTAGGAAYRWSFQTGVWEETRLKAEARVPSIVRNSLVIPESPMPKSQCPMLLLDIGGRRVMKLQPGVNDVSHLAPGVYFVKDEGGRLKDEPGSRMAVRKVIIQR